MILANVVIIIASCFPTCLEVIDTAQSSAVAAVAAMTEFSRFPGCNHLSLHRPESILS